MLLMHILHVACIDDCDCVALDGVSVVPLIGIGHVKTRPSTDGGATTWGSDLSIV